MGRCGAIGLCKRGWFLTTSTLPVPFTPNRRQGYGKLIVMCYWTDNQNNQNKLGTRKWAWRNVHATSSNALLCAQKETPAEPTYLNTPFFLLPSPLLTVGMAATSTTQVSASEYLNPQSHYRPPSPTTSLSPTLVNAPRPSLILRFPCGSSNILNSLVVDAAGQSLYSISSNSKRTTMVSCRDNIGVASVNWDRSSPRMVFRSKKMKCKEWLPITGPESEYAPVYPSAYP